MHSLLAFLSKIILKKNKSIKKKKKKTLSMPISTTIKQKAKN